MKEQINTLDKMRKSIKAAAKKTEFELPMDPVFFDNLHDNIMAKIAESTIEPVSTMRTPRKFLRGNWREWFCPVGGTTALALIATLIAK